MFVEEAIINDQPAKPYSNESLVFRYLPGYAAFIRDNCLIPYIKEQVVICRTIDLPMMKFLEGISDDELVMMGIESHRLFLTSAEHNTLKEHLEVSLNKWVSDQLVIMKKEDLTAQDITYAGYVRKKSLVKFLPAYTNDLNEAIEIINEIDALSVHNDIAATNVYIKLLKDRISEQAFFTEILSNTTPGLNYIFDLGSRSIKYANKNAVTFFGNSVEEMQQMGSTIIANNVHPDDVQLTIEALEKCAAAVDGSVISWEFRLRAEDGSYPWMRNYASVYKRDDAGTPSEIVGIILNIDKEKEISDKLVLSEKQLLEAQALTNLGSFELEPETGKMVVTPQFKTIYELDEFDLSNLIDHVHPDDKERINKNRDRAIREGGMYDNEYRYIINGNEKILWTRGSVTVRNGRKVMIGTAMDVTNRHKMLRELLESRALYQQAQQLSQIGNWNCNLETNEYSWSDELFRIYELEPPFGKIEPGMTRSYRHPDDVAMVDEQERRLREEYVPSDYIFRINLPSAKLKYLHVKGEASFDEHGKAIGLYGTVQDVTEKQLLFEKLKESDALSKQAQELSHIGNWSWDLVSGKIIWSDELYRIYGRQPGTEITFDKVMVLNDPEDRVKIKQNLQDCIDTGKPMETYYRAVLKDGSRKTLYARTEALIDKAGKTYKVIGTIQDVTAQKLVEKKLEDSQEFIQKITDVTPSIIAAYNIQSGQFSFINGAIEKQLGYPVSEVMEGGVPFFVSITHPDDLQALMEKNARALEEANMLLPGAEEPVVEFKYRMKNNEGAYKWFHTFGTIFERNESGLVESILNISIDVTEQEEAEQAVYQKNLQLQQSNTSLEDYAYVASHDLKEPLRKIVTFSDRMLTSQSATLSDDGKLYLGKIIESSRRMQKMVNDLLYVSTITGNKEYQLSDLNLILSEALQPLDHKIEELNAIVDSDDLPMVAVVPAQFSQLFLNLVGNSLKFQRVGVMPEIKISHRFLPAAAVARRELAKAKRYLQIEVQDNGIGFDNQYSGKIFAIFQRLHGRSEYEGTGIGLAVCKRIVENHGGAIFASGKVNEGATFTIVIPV